MRKCFPTREVKVGHVGVGGDNPIRIQSMTTSKTEEVEETVSQILCLAEAGCEIVRVTVQGKKQARACEKIKDTLIKKGCTLPLVADIHFYPPAAMQVADFADKVRINPGNFADPRAVFKKRVYDEAGYREELLRLEEKFMPLVLKCKRLKKALRIGVNHGSLSDRIMNVHGDTPRGMVVSAIEYAEICRKCDYHAFVFSMKSSNPQIMITAYRQLVDKMRKLGWNYPLHLGVTEAGEGEDGRIKSGIGIGTLLLEGLGDTIRVSLSEDPWQEIGPCRQLVSLAKEYQLPSEPVSFSFRERKAAQAQVFVKVKAEEMVQENFFKAIGCVKQLGHFVKEPSSVEGIILEEEGDEKVLALVEKAGIKVLRKRLVLDEREKQWEVLLKEKPDVVFFSPQKRAFQAIGRFFSWLQENRISLPIILEFSSSEQAFLIRMSAELGGWLCAGLGEGVLVDVSQPLEKRKWLGFSLLQAARRCSFKTEFISCPGCGRTLFDLQSVVSRIQKKTSHLAGVKIAVMGCIVNGPGEMADADFGYVGSAPGKIDLYVGKQCVEKAIEASKADEQLIALIKKEGMWVEPS